MGLRSSDESGICPNAVTPIYVHSCEECSCCYVEKEKGEHSHMCNLLDEEVYDVRDTVDSRCPLREKNHLLILPEGT